MGNANKLLVTCLEQRVFKGKHSRTQLLGVLYTQCRMMCLHICLLSQCFVSETSERTLWNLVLVSALKTLQLLQSVHYNPHLT